MTDDAVALPGGHLDLDALADLLAGEGSERDVEHVGTCARCAADLADLEDAQAPVAAALRALPAPEPPADLLADLRGRLAAEGSPEPPAAGRVASGAGAEPEPDAEDEPPRRDSQVRVASAASTVTPLPARRSRPAWLPSAAAAVLVLSAAGLFLGLLGRGGDQSSDTAAPAAGSAAESGANPAADALAGVAFNASGTDYGRDPGALAQALPSVLSGTAPPGAPPSPAAGAPASTGPSDDQPATPGLERLRDPAALASCLSALLPPDMPDVRPLALDYAAYAGQPALVVVLPAADPTKVDVFVVGAGCDATNDATLFFTRLDRPA